MKSGIYKIENIANGKIYIGSTIDFKERWKRHRIYLRKGKHTNRHLQGAWNIYGESGFSFTVLEECENNILIEREQFFMDTLRPEYNIRLIAESNRGLVGSESMKQKMSQIMKGRVFTQEWKDKISKAKMGNKAFLGKKHTQESKDKLSAERKGKKLPDCVYAGLNEWRKTAVVSEETRRKLSEAGKGRVVSEETRKKISNSRKGIKISDELKEKLRKANLGNKYSLGHTHPEERRLRISESLKKYNQKKREENAV